jgi:hypothetical protein
MSSGGGALAQPAVPKASAHGGRCDLKMAAC